VIGTMPALYIVVSDCSWVIGLDPLANGSNHSNHSISDVAKHITHNGNQPPSPVLASPSSPMVVPSPSRPFLTLPPPMHSNRSVVVNSPPIVPMGSVHVIMTSAVAKGPAIATLNGFIIAVEVCSI
jgi:hypothetical protein